MHPQPHPPNVPSNFVTWDEAELLELYRECDDEWRDFVMMSALAAAEQHNGHAPPGRGSLTLVDGWVGRRYPPHRIRLLGRTG